MKVSCDPYSREHQKVLLHRSCVKKHLETLMKHEAYMIAD